MGIKTVGRQDGASKKSGKQHGGIRTLADLKSRCRIDEDSECWLWTGAVQQRSASFAEPRVWLADKEVTTTLGRAAWGLAGKDEPVPGKYIWRRYCSSLCGNPDHLMVGTRKQWGAWLVERGHWRGRPERSLINRRVTREFGIVVLNEESAQWIRESQQPNVEIAHALGCSTTTVSRVKLGITWRVGVPGSSVFNLSSANQSMFKVAA